MAELGLLTHLYEVVRRVEVLFHAALKVRLQVIWDFSERALVNLVALLEQQESVEQTEHFCRRLMNCAQNSSVVVYCFALEHFYDSGCSGAIQSTSGLITQQ